MKAPFRSVISTACVIFLAFLPPGARGAPTPLGGVSDAGPGELWVVGWNNFGQLGDGTNTEKLSPTLTHPSVSIVSAASNHSLFVKGDGTLWSVGDNSSSALGDGSLINRNTPVNIDTGILAIAAGRSHSLYLRTDGTLLGTGNNGSGQLGNKPDAYLLTPLAIDTNVKAVAADYHTLYIRTDGTLLGMGYNSHGQLGPANIGSNVKIPVVIDTDVKAAAAGSFHTLYLKEDGTLMALGSNQYGQLGDGTNTDRHSPVVIDTDVRSIAAGWRHSLYIKWSFSLRGMGYNVFGQLGDGTTTDRKFPIAIAPDVIKMSAGYYHSAFVLADGTLKGMGNNAGLAGPKDGWTTIPTVIDTGVSAVSAGNQFTMYLKVPPPPAPLIPGVAVTLGAAATYELPITVEGDWTIEETEDWVSLSKTSGSGPETLTITLVRNEGEDERTAIVTINGVAYTLTQANVSRFDEWLSEYLSLPEMSDPTKARPESDIDGDGLPNYFEFLARLDPLDPDSSMRLHMAPVSPTTLRFGPMPEIPGPSYYFQYSTDLSGWTNLDPEERSRVDGELQVDISSLPDNALFRVEVREAKR